MHSSQSLFLALSPLLSLVSAQTFYAQSDIYQGDTFFDKFNFFTDVDPTGGYVDYKSQIDASTLGLISTTGTSAKWGVGGGILDPNDNTIRGRPAVRLEGKTSYTKGLFVADIAHMPGNACGIWPSFWTLGSGTWPLNGEIDIIEGVNQLTTNKASLHSGTTTCAIQSAPQFGAIQSTDCETIHNGNMDNFVGCGINSGSSASFGTPFNSHGGGTYAMQWTDTFIKTWFFPRGSEPASLSCSAPDVTEFGIPDTFFSGCDIASNFKDHHMVFTTTFCGSWAGADGVYDQAGCPLTFPSTEPQWKSCKAQVAGHPETFTEGFWEVNSIKVFSETPTPPTCSSSSSSSSSIASSTSSSASSSSSIASSTSSSASSSSSSASSSSSSASSSSSSASSSSSSSVASSASSSGSSSSSATSSASSASSSATSSPSSSYSSTATSSASSSYSSSASSSASSSYSSTASTSSVYSSTESSSTYSTYSYPSGRYTNSSSSVVSTTSYSSDYYPSSATASTTSSVNYDPYGSSSSSSASSSSVNYYDPYDPSSSSSVKSTTSSSVYGYDWKASTTSSAKYTTSSSKPFVSYPPITTCTYPVGFQPIKAVIKSVIVTNYVYGSMTSKVTKTSSYCAMCHYTETAKTAIKVATSGKASVYLSGTTTKYKTKVHTVTVKKSTSSTPVAPVKPSTSSCGTVTSTITVKGTRSSAVVVPSYPAKANGTSSYPVAPVKAVVTPPAVYNLVNATTTSYNNGNSTSYSPLQVTKNAAGKNVAGGLALIGAAVVAVMML